MSWIKAEIILAFTGVLATIGGGFKYLLARVETERVRIEAERVRYELKVDQERLKHEALIADQIAEMRKELALQDREIVHLRCVSDAYIRHVAILHHLMREAGIAIPELVLPKLTIEGT